MVLKVAHSHVHSSGQNTERDGRTDRQLVAITAVRIGLHCGRAVTVQWYT